MINLSFEKIYSTDRLKENCSVSIPFKQGEIYSASDISVTDVNNKEYASYSKPLSFWKDGSIKWLFTRFEADIYANKGAEYLLHTDKKPSLFDGISFENDLIDTGSLKIKLGKGTVLFDFIEYEGKKYNNIIKLPDLKDKEGNTYLPIINNVKTLENNKLCTIIKLYGSHTLNNEKIYSFEIRLTFYRNKSAFELSYRLINTTENDLNIKSLVIPLTKELNGDVRTVSGISNYKTRFTKTSGEEIYTYIDAQLLKYEANEHNAEVFYGTFFGDVTDEECGITASLYQAHQNFPKAFKINKGTMEIMLVPENIEDIVFHSGMAREQKVLFYFHSPNEDIQSINNKTIIYQMPDKPRVSPRIFRDSTVFPNVFTDKYNYDIELFITSKADEHARCFGMLNWGDAPDLGYTEQGRGGGALVWTNNEYDFPHSCTLQYVRTGTRRFLDYMLVAAEHQMDVDVCHFSNDPLIMDGQYEHTKGHTLGNNVVCSHQWVEGLLDYYHFTGNIEAYNTAIGIGKNVTRLLETPIFATAGETSARETGWALRTLTALYSETNDEKWLEKCDWIVDHFKTWESKYGLWLAPYTDNAAIRVVFMISVAVGSLMRYYRVRKNSDIKDMILRAVKDLCDNARLENGLFYYKELPSLKRPGNNPLILEALTIAYELSGDIEYIKAGIPTLKYVMSYKAANLSFNKRIEENSVIQGNSGTKSFAQLMIPVTVFYVAASQLDLI